MSDLKKIEEKIDNALSKLDKETLEQWYQLRYEKEKKCNYKCNCKCKNNFIPTDFFLPTDDPWLFVNKKFILEKTTINSWILYYDADVVYRGFILNNDFAKQLFENTTLKK